MRWNWFRCRVPGARYRQLERYAGLLERTARNEAHRAEGLCDAWLAERDLADDALIWLANAYRELEEHVPEAAKRLELVRPFMAEVQARRRTTLRKGLSRELPRAGD